MTGAPQHKSRPLPEGWDKLNITDCLSVLAQDEEPIDSALMARLALGGLNFKEIQKLYFMHRERTPEAEEHIYGLKSWWNYGHIVAKTQHKERLNKIIDASETLKSADVAALKLLYEMDKRALELQEQDDKSESDDFSDEDLDAFLDKMTG